MKSFPKFTSGKTLVEERAARRVARQSFEQAEKAKAMATITVRHYRRLQHGDAVPTETPRRYSNQQGYILLRWPEPGGFVEVLEHRLVAGLPPENMDVHHRNGVKDDNRPENLEVLAPIQHGRKHRQPDFDVSAAGARYLAGENLIGLARSVGVHHVTVLRRLRAYGYKIRSVSESMKRPVDADAVERLYRADVPVPAIAASLGVSDMVVRRVVKERHLPRRGKGWYWRRSKGRKRCAA